MMKNFIYKISALFITTLVWISCIDNSVKPMFDKSINERATELRLKYEKIITKPKDGWIGYYKPNRTAPTYALLLKFREDKSAVIHSEYQKRAYDDTVTYRIDKTLKTELVFETHGLFHKIFETNRNNYEGEFVFNISSAEENKVVLVSKTDNGYGKSEVTQLTLKPAKASDWKLDWIADGKKKLIHKAGEKPFRNLLINDQPFGNFSYSSAGNKVKIKYKDDKDKVVIVNNSIGITREGFTFSQPLKLGKHTILNFVYDSKTGVFTDSENNAKIIYSDLPYILPSDHKDIVDNSVMKQLIYFHKDTDLPPGLTSKAFEDKIAVGPLDFRIYNNYKSTNPAVSGKHFIGVRTRLGLFILAFYTYELKNDKIILKLSGKRRTSHKGANAIMDVLFSPGGFYVENLGRLTRYTNHIYQLTSADDPKIQIAFYASTR